MWVLVPLSLVSGAATVMIHAAHAGINACNRSLVSQEPLLATTTAYASPSYSMNSTSDLLRYGLIPSMARYACRLVT